MNCRSAVTWPLWALVVSTALLGGCMNHAPTRLPATPAARSPQASPPPAPSAPAAEAPRPALDGLIPADAWLLGEQHDAPAHQARQRAVLQALQAEGRLAALVIEMAERGTSTQGLPLDAEEPAVRQALRWSSSQSAGWDWATYGPLVMQAVRAGVPVLGGNLPRTEMRHVMQDSSLDQRLDNATWLTQQTQIREGHCQLLPETQVVPMTRVQIARDRAMARTVQSALRPGKTVMLVAGNQHVRRDLGVPRHWPPSLRSTVVMMVSGESPSPQANAQADRVWHTEALPPKDHCAAFRKAKSR